MNAPLDHILANTQPAKRAQQLGVLVCALVISFFIWATFIRLDQVAIAMGTIVPEGEVKTVQHFEGGIITEILVTEGALVKAGDPLIRLNPQATSINAEELEVKMDSLRLSAARLEAEANGGKLQLPADIVKRRPDLAAAERDSHRARENQVTSTLAVVREQRNQRSREVEEIQAVLDATRRDLKLAQDNLELTRGLLADKLVSQFELNEQEREVQNLIGRLESYQASLPRAQAARAEANKRETEERNRFRTLAAEERRRVTLELARLEEQHSRAVAQRQRTQIDAPIAGIIKNLRYHTIGGIVRPGDPVLELVPLDETLVVRAALSPADVGNVHPGQSASIKLTAYDFMRYGALEGIVRQVSPDAKSDGNGAPYFEVIVETRADQVDTNQNELKIIPGMQAQIDIKTGNRSLANYLLKPLLKVQYEAFREP
ncbi:MAG: HlyD family type I secretion periplasmic adaptor subunit [Alphaproteobacteria bacterium]